MSGRIARVIAGITILMSASASHAGDMINGESAVATIQQMRSYATYTEFLLIVPQAGCGTPGYSESWWRMPLDGTEANRYKRAILLGAFLSGRPVKLRCEASQVTDFTVAE
jgi:hypothetical protein